MKTTEPFIIIRPITHLPGCPHGIANGYVAIPPNHPKYKTEDDFEVHGGITYREIENHENADFWVIGFDTAHYCDTLERCDMNYVIKECFSLLEQVNKMTL